MDFSTLFALPDGLEVAETSVIGHVLTLSLVAQASTAMCPLCGQASQHRRGSYMRHVADVPSAGRQVQLILRVRKFRCDTVDCPRRVFAERLTPFIEPWARMTTRLSQTIEAIGLATSGELGSRFAPRLGIDDWRIHPWRAVLIWLVMRSDWIAISNSCTCVKRASRTKK